MTCTQPLPRFLLAQRADVDFFPPVLNQARLLGELGHVTLLDAPPSQAAAANREVPAAARIHRVRVGGSARLATPLRRSGNLVGFLRAYWRALLARPELAIAYEIDAGALLVAFSVLHPRMRRIIHLHEVPDAELLSRSRVSSLARGYLARHIQRADLVIVADSMRAALLMREWQLQTSPTVVMNCPLRQPQLPESRLLPLVRERGLPISRIVHYQGSMGADHGLEQVLRSMPHWPEDSVLALVGGGPVDYVNRLRELATQNGMSERILWLGRVPYDEVLSYAVGASVGLSILAPSNNNWKYAAGASNKRFEYAALGIPQVTNEGPGITELFTHPGIATAVAAHDARAIAEAIGQYLCDQTASAKASERARRLHLSTYNYEAQFEPVLRIIRDWCLRD